MQKTTVRISGSPSPHNYIPAIQFPARRFSTSASSLNFVPEQQFTIQQLSQKAAVKRQLWRSKPLLDRIKTDTGTGVIREFREHRRLLDSKPTTENVEPNIGQTIDFLRHIAGKSHVSLSELVRQKRQMLLLRMRINEKTEKVHQFRQMKQEKEDKIHVFQTMIEQDEEWINRFVEEDKLLTKEQMRLAENITREKAQVINRLKEINERKTIKVNVNLKLVEKLKQLWMYKEFLDPLFKGRSFGFGKEELRAIVDASEKRDSVEEKEMSAAIGKVRIADQAASVGKSPSHKEKNAIESLRERGFLSRKRIVMQNQNNERKQGFNARRSIVHFEQSPQISGSKERNPSNRRTLPQTIVSTKPFISQSYSVASEPLLSYLVDETARQTCQVKDPNLLLDLNKQIEDENIELLQTVHTLKKEHDEKMEKLQQCTSNQNAKIEDLTRMRKALIAKIDNLKRILDRGHTQHNAAQEAETSENIKLLSASMIGLSKVIGLKFREDAKIDDVLEQIERRLMRLIDRLAKFGSQHTRKCEKIINEGKKFESQREQQTRARELSEAKKLAVVVKAAPKLIVRQSQPRSYQILSFRRKTTNIDSELARQSEDQLFFE